MAESDLITRFVGPNAAYYERVFAVIQSGRGSLKTFNPAAALFGPVWAGMRGLSFLFLLLILLDLLALSVIAAGVGGNTGSAVLARAQQLEETVAKRRADAAAALAKSDAVTAATSTRLADNLQKAADAARAEAGVASAGAGLGIWLGVLTFLVVRLATGFGANLAYEQRFTAWRGNQNLPHGAPLGRLIVAALIVAATYFVTLYARVAAAPPTWLTKFPADRQVFSAVEKSLDSGFVAVYEAAHGAFDGVRNGIRLLVDGFEAVLVGTPWPVVMLLICTLAVQLAGWRVAIFTMAALAYLGLFGFWELSMQTVSLLGAASILCILFGIPLGIWFARSKTAFAVAQPVLDFMQTMPAFVYLIPVIAFFGTGKPPGIIATLIFGMPPVIRLTTLGLNGVPEDVKEAARAYGATEWQVLTGVELPLAQDVHPGGNQPDDPDVPFDGGYRVFDRRAGARVGCAAISAIRSQGARASGRAGHSLVRHGDRQNRARELPTARVIAGTTCDGRDL